jgi:thiol-disulfide isomerase/thioredoxin
MKKLFIPIAIIIVGLIIAGVIVYTNASKPSEEGSYLSLQEATDKMINFINNSILQGQGTASLVDSVEKNGLYSVKFEFQGEEVEWTMTKDGAIIFPQMIDIAEFESTAKQEEEGATIGSFTTSVNDVCYEENGTPIVYFFGSQSCPHCLWEHPIVEGVMAKFGSLVSFHNNMDTDADMDIFSQYSTGGIPTLVIGCKYYRVGSGESAGEELDAKNITALTCKITNNQPAEVCSQVQDLIDQI